MKRITRYQEVRGILRSALEGTDVDPDALTLQVLNTQHDQERDREAMLMSLLFDGAILLVVVSVIAFAFKLTFETALLAAVMAIVAVAILVLALSTSIYFLIATLSVKNANRR